MAMGEAAGKPGPGQSQGKRQKTVVFRKVKDQAVLADQIQVAESFGTRLLGLIGRKSLAGGEGLLFPRCNSVHMWFMRLTIDVVFMRQSGQGRWIISSLHPAVKPWRVLPLWDFRATHALELPEGTIERSALKAGEELCSS